MTSKKVEIIKHLESSSSEVRRLASRQLATLPSKESLDLIILAIADEDWRVRKETIATLQEISTTETLIDRLIEGLIQENNIGLRSAAADALSKIGPEAVNVLIDRLPSLPHSSLKISLETIGQLENSRAATILIKSLKDSDNNIKVCAAELLRKHNSLDVQRALISCIDRNDHLLTLAALGSLNQINAKISWSNLEPLTGDDMFRGELLLAAGRTGEPRASEYILSQLVHDSSAVMSLEMLHSASPEAANAVNISLRGCDKDVMKTLKSIARGNDGVEQRTAVKCLLWTRKKDIVSIIVELAGRDLLYPMLLQQLEEWGQEITSELETILPSLTGRNLASAIGLLSRLMSDDAGSKHTALFWAALNSNDIIVATAAAGAIGRFGDDTVIDRLIEMTGSENCRLRRAAGHALIGLKNHREAVRQKLKQVTLEGQGGVELCRIWGFVGKLEDAAHLESVLNYPDPALRKAVLKPLAMIAQARALSSLSLAITDENIDVQVAAATALPHVGSAASEAIAAALKNAHGPLKVALVTALGEVGHIDAESILTGMLTDPNDIAITALKAMRSLALSPRKMEKKLLDHEDTEVVKRALLFLGSEVSRPELFKLLSHDHWDVRLATIEILRLSQDNPSVIAKLQGRLDVEKNDLVKRSIEQILTPLKGRR